MPSRAQDWIAQAERDLAHDIKSVELKDYEWACFAAHQAAEKALKAVYQDLSGEAKGHSLRGLLLGLVSRLTVPRTLEVKASELDKNYIPTRYPDALQAGAPFDLYTRNEAERAIRNARSIVEFCKSHLA